MGCLLVNQAAWGASTMETDAFPRLIEGLMRPDAYPHAAAPVAHIETHISHVFLAGEFAYKFKKPVNLEFLDFSTLALRHHFCEEELRLNRRLAPDLYLDVIAVTGTPSQPRVQGDGECLEYAVKMRRFPQEALLDRQALSGELMGRLAELVADFHARIPVADAQSHYGDPVAVLAPMRDNLRQIRACSVLPEHLLMLLDHLDDWTHKRFAELTAVLEQRRDEGYVRECHGDMHRGNIALVDGEIRIFDGIEFSPALRWIDTASEIAFLIMDLEQADKQAHAQCFLNRYLERSGDYGALVVLDFYKVYRAMVRAKVLAIRLGQGDLDPAERAETHRRCSHYLQQAHTYTHARRANLLIACGLSGSGKSWLSERLRLVLPMIHLRSDLERKRLFGLHEMAQTESQLENGIYFPSATDWTYDRLYCLAESILDSGYDVLVDATFIARARRARFHALARAHGAGFAILFLDAPVEVLRERVARRLAQGRDASEANLAVLERQHAARECLDETEQRFAVTIDTSREQPLEDVLAKIQMLLEQNAGSGFTRASGRETQSS